eukprot:scaffold2069_cov254-Pinguiococcus_pyrenoidosus.AAC.1
MASSGMRVADEVLDARRYALRAVEAVFRRAIALHAPDIRRGQVAHKHRVLSVRLEDAGPAGLAHHSHHRTEDPWDAGLQRGPRGPSAHFLRHLGAKSCRLGQLLREDHRSFDVRGAVDTVDPVENWADLRKRRKAS